MSNHPPIRSLRDLNTATADQIRLHICWELRRLIHELGTSQLDVAVEMGYKTSAGAFSRYITGKEALPLKRARRLTERYPEFVLPLDGQTFLSLAELEGERRRKTIVSVPLEYDVFLAAPMSAAAGSDPGEDIYWQARDDATELVRALDFYCGFSVYYAGKEIEASHAFESAGISIEMIAEALERSRFFVLLAVNLPDKASSIFVEAGMALALNKPSMYFVSQPLELPWLLRGMQGHRSSVLPRSSLEYVRSIRDVVGLLQQHGARLFTQLEESR